MRSLRMRTTLLLSLLAVSFGLTAVTLLVVRVTLKQRVAEGLASDLQHSVDTFANQRRQRRDMLEHESALLADLPSLKALMTTHDRSTIADGSQDFWHVSGSDFFALADSAGALSTYSSKDVRLEKPAVKSALSAYLNAPGEPRMVSIGGVIYELAVQPLYFGSSEGGTRLGYVAIGYAVNQRVAREVSEVASAEVAFSADGAIAVTTLDPQQERELRRQLAAQLYGKEHRSEIRLGQERYLATNIPLSPSGSGDVQMIVLKSYDRASGFLSRLNEGMALLGILSLIVGGLLALGISRTVTRPLETLVRGARALGGGDFDYRLEPHGATEVRELSQAFDGMRVELRRTQNQLLDSERLATIGRMASSISHDLRHYLSAMYANAEFLSLPGTPQAERDELLEEVKSAIQGMTDLIESLLIFSRTGLPLHPSYEPIGAMARTEANVLRSHPEVRRVSIVLRESAPVSGWVDARKLSRAIFNLLLNACQAAARGDGPPMVLVEIVDDGTSFGVRVTDNGCGVPPSIRETLFEPFVSAGKQSGTGLGLTVAQHIAQEHGGSVHLEESRPGKTVFSLALPRALLKRPKALVPDARQVATIP